MEYKIGKRWLAYSFKDQKRQPMIDFYSIDWMSYEGELIRYGEI